MFSSYICVGEISINDGLNLCYLPNNYALKSKSETL